KRSDSTLRFVTEDVADRLQILQPLSRVRLDVASLGPLVPRVDSQDPRTALLGKQSLVSDLEGLAEPLGHVAADGVGERIPEAAELVRLVRAWARVPAHGHVREIGRQKVGGPFR